MPVTITACANSTPVGGTIIATKTVASQDYQQFILSDNNGSALGQVSGSPVYFSLVNSTGSVALTNPTGSVNIINSTGSMLVTNIPASVVVSNWTGSAAGSPIFASITNLAGSAAGSPLFASITNSTGSVNIINSTGSMLVTNLTGSAAGSPLFVTQNNMTGSAAGSPLFASITNLAGSAAGSPLFASITNSTGSVNIINSTGSLIVTNLTGSAAGSPIFASITNLSGSVAGSPLFASITNSVSAIQGTPACPAGAWPIVITDRTNNFGFSNSPLAVTFDVMNVYFAGSLLAASNANISAASAACTRIVASSNGKAIIIFAATFTTSGCQNIGWIASGAGGASTNVQTAMPFGTYGGMDANRVPNALWIFPSGSNAIMTTTSGCIVAGNLTYTYATS